jgi:hypothetical protein
LTLDELSYNGTAVAIPSLPMDVYNSLVKCRVKEVVEDCASIDTINVGDIIDVAFVFHTSTLEKEYVNCAGMSRFFYTRYQLINGGLSAIDHYLHLPFSNVFIESYPLRLWFFIFQGGEVIT